MQSLKNYTKEFFHDESGMELLQLAVNVVITVMLIGAVMLIAYAIYDGLQGSAEQVKDGFGQAGVDIELREE